MNPGAMKVLLVDNEAGRRSSLATNLTKLGHEVVEKSNGKEAWLMYLVEQPRLVITESALNELNGLELCRKIRSARGSKYAYLIVLASEATKVKFLEAMDAGADDFLPQPCDLMDIVLRLRVAERLLQLSSTVTRLESRLPICSYCKQIRDDREEWHPVDRYVHQRSEASFSHGVCPECYQSHIEPQLQAIRTQKSMAAEAPQKLR
jgi:phosphoserine phosphatase RsbU/P